MTGDAAATDPVCRFSSHHEHVVAIRESAQTDEFVYRTMKPPREPRAPVRQTVW
jgi:pyrroloquinoline quinone biosynthesis protein E